MLRRFPLLLLFTFTITTSLFGQTVPKASLVSDSVIAKFKIKQITENGFGNTSDLNPYWTTFETFDSTGRITQRTSINYAYHKFVHDFRYNTEDEITITEKYYDWNPNRKNKNDTILKTSDEKYNLKTKEGKELKPVGPGQFQAKKIMDSIGRVIQRTDTIKFGYSITYYQYNGKGDLVEIKRYDTRNSEKPGLVAIDRFVYDAGGHKIKEVNYSGFKTKDGIEKHDKEVETLFYYNDLGLLKQKLIATKYLSLKNSGSNSVMYKYEYSFY